MFLLKKVARNQSNYQSNSNSNKNEGEVSIDKMPNKNKSKSDKLGDYVDYEEID